jgi:hypothetical protein
MLYRYRLFEVDGSEAGEAHYAVLIELGEQGHEPDCSQPAGRRNAASCDDSRGSSRKRSSCEDVRGPARAFT